MKTERKFVTTFIYKSTKGTGDMLDLTPEVREGLQKSNFQEGIVNLFVVGSTAGITTIEYEPGLIKDMAEFYEKIIPSDMDYRHHQTWSDHNGFSHVRAALQGPSMAVPFKEGELLLGTWQQIVLLEFDDQPRNRKIVLQMDGI